MAREVIVLGDNTSHGGRVITARARMTIDGIPVALWGDHCSCPYCGHDNCVICEGEVEAMYDGVPVALEGHKTSCGATLFPARKGRADSKPLVKKQAAVASVAAAGVVGAKKEKAEIVKEEDPGTLRVMEIEGPKVVDIETTAKYRVIKFNQSPSEDELRLLKWKIEVYTKQNALLEVVENGQRPDVLSHNKEILTIQKMPVKWSNCSIKIFAYFKRPTDEASVSTKVKFIPFLIAESTQKPRIGADWGYGDYGVARYKQISPALENDELLNETDGQLLTRMEKLLKNFSAKDTDGLTNQMFLQFKSKNGGIFSSPVLVQKAKAHPSVKSFVGSVHYSLDKLVAARKYELSTKELLVRKKQNGSEWNRVAFNTDPDVSNGLKVLINAVWAYRVELEDYEMTGSDAYRAKIKITLYDHFGLDEEDIKKFGIGNPFQNDATLTNKVVLSWSPAITNGFRAWFLLQRRWGYQPVLTTIEFSESIN